MNTKTNKIKKNKTNKFVEKKRIDYIVNVNGRVVKAGSARVDFSKLQEFDMQLIQEYTKRPGKDVVEIQYR